MNPVYDAMRENSGWLEEQIRAADHDKTNVSVEVSGRRLERIYQDYAGRCALGFEVKVSFADVHALMGFAAHTQLAYVRLDGRRCELLFHPRLIEVPGYVEGFNFVQKCWVLLAVLRRVVDLSGPMRRAFVFEAGDTGVFESVSFCSRHPKACLIIDDEFAFTRGYQDFKLAADTVRRPWGERKPDFFWRGSTTGLRAHEPLEHEPKENDAAEDWTWLQRLALCRSAREAEVERFCDVGLTRVVQIGEPSLVRRIETSGFMKPSVERTEFVKHQYVFDIDGNSNSWSGLYCSLYGGACVLKVESPHGFRQWYYDDLVAGRNYIPIKRDLSNLGETIGALRRGEMNPESVAREGERLARGITAESALDTSARNVLAWFGRMEKAA